MSSSARRAALLSAPLLAVALVAGCGSSTPTPAASGSPSSSSAATTASKPSVSDLFANTKAAALAAKSAHVVGEMTTGGKVTKIDLAGDAQGANQKLLISQGNEGSAEVLTVAGQSYLKGDAAFWTANGGAAAATKLAGTYVSLPAAQAKQMAGITLGALLKQMFGQTEMGALATLNTAVNDTTFAGAPAFTLTERVGGDGAELTVSADGKARLLQLKGPAKEPGQLTFTEWDAVMPFEAPDDSEITPFPGSTASAS